jgi:3-oxoadipate enol-lactonase
VPHARIRDIDVYYERAGEGPRLLFVSGTGGDLRQRPSVFSGPLARRFDLLAYDQRGLGRTSKPEGPYAMADYADDAAGLLAHLDWERAAVLGVSFGGMVAQELALRHPERVSRLVLACTSSGGDGGASYPLHELESLAPRERAIRALELSDVRCDESWRRSQPEAFEKALSLYAARQTGSSDDPAAAAGARRQLEARREHDTFERLARIACPTFVCTGRFDGIAPPANSATLAARIPGSKLELFDGGHLFMIQDRAALPAMIDFLVGGAGG